MLYVTVRNMNNAVCDYENIQINLNVTCENI